MNTSEKHVVWAMQFVQLDPPEHFVQSAIDSVTLLEVQRGARKLFKVWGFFIPPPSVKHTVVHFPVRNPERARVDSEALLHAIRLEDVASGREEGPDYAFLSALARALNSVDAEKFKTCVGCGAPYFRHDRRQKFCTPECQSRCGLIRFRENEKKRKGKTTRPPARKVTR